MTQSSASSCYFDNRMKGFLTTLWSGPAHFVPDLTKDLNNVLDSPLTDPDGFGSKSELEGSDGVPLAFHLSASPMNESSAKPSSSITKKKSSA